MPMYEFECEDCGHQFEQLIRREQDIASLNCPKCAHHNVRRSLSLPSAPLQQLATSTGGGCGPGPNCGKPWCQRTG